MDLIRNYPQTYTDYLLQFKELIASFERDVEKLQKEYEEAVRRRHVTPEIKHIEQTFRMKNRGREKHENEK